MTPSPPSAPTGRPPNPFLDRPAPEPLTRSPQFHILLLLVAGLVIAIGMWLYFASIARSREAAEAARIEAQAALPALTTLDQGERDQRLMTLFEGALADTRNGDAFMQTTGYRRLLEILISYPAEEIERRATRKLDWTAAMANPDAWRGEFVWTRGIVLNLYAVKLEDPVFGMRDVYEGILADADGSDGVFFHTPDPLPEIELREDVVDVRGIFYRTARYQTFKELKTEELPPYRERTPEGEFQTAPFLLAKTIEKVVEPERDAAGFLKDNTAMLLIGMALAIGAVHLLVYRFQRRAKRRAVSQRAEKAGFREMFEKRVREDSRAAGPRSQA